MRKPRHSGSYLLRCSIIPATRTATDASCAPSRVNTHGSRWKWWLAFPSCRTRTDSPAPVSSALLIQIVAGPPPTTATSRCVSCQPRESAHRVWMKSSSKPGASPRALDCIANRIAARTGLGAAHGIARPAATGSDRDAEASHPARRIPRWGRPMHPAMSTMINLYAHSRWRRCLRAATRCRAGATDISVPLKGKIRLHPAGPVATRFFMPCPGSPAEPGVATRSLKRIRME